MKRYAVRGTRRIRFVCWALVLVGALGGAWGQQASFVDDSGAVLTYVEPGVGPEAVLRDGRPVDDMADVRDVIERGAGRHGVRERRLVQFVSEPLARAGQGSAKAIRDAAAAVQADHDHFRADLAAILDESGAAKRGVESRHSYVRVFNGVAVSLTDREVEEVRRLDYVKNVFRDAEVQVHLNASVPRIHADRVWNDLGATGEGVVVGIIDTGIDYTHPDLGGGYGPGYKVIGGYDFRNDDEDPMDDHGHGTHCAGIVAANGILKGVARGASLMALKVLDSSGSGEWSDVVAGIEWATDPDGDPATDDALDVISLSLGAPGDPTDPPCQAIDNAVALGVVCVLSAGNTGFYETIGSPGCAREGIAVGAAEAYDDVADFSSRGPVIFTSDIKPEICAPGVSIVSLDLGEGTIARSGTSMACPHISGAAALLLELHPDWTPRAIKSALMGTAVDMGLDALAQGAGLVDVFAAAQTDLLVDPPAINFGFDDLTLSVWTAQRALTVRNVGGSAVTYEFAVDESSLPAGVTTVVTSSVYLEAGESATVDMQVTVDNALVANLTGPPYAYWGYVEATSTERVLRFPFAFNKEQPDAMEPNNVPAQATPITVEDSRKQIRVGGRTGIDPMQLGASLPDEDWFRFEGEAGRRLFVYVDSFLTFYSGLDGILELYDGNLERLERVTTEDGEPRITFWVIPETGTYYLRILSEATVGRYKLYVNYLPSDVRFYWTPEEPAGGNPVSFVNFADGGDYLYTGQWYNRLTLFDTAGSGVPVYNLEGASNSLFASAHDGQPAYATFAHTSGDDTWTYDATGWHQLSPSRAPARLGAQSMAYDRARGQVVLFGGRWELDGFSDATWIWNGVNWTQFYPSTQPLERLRMVMAYDAGRQVTVMFGGIGGDIYDYDALADTWEWDGTNWHAVPTLTAPEPRFSQAMAYDAARGVTVLFGGYVDEGWTNDTWEYDGTDWAKRETGTAPDYGYSPAMVYDSLRHETVLVTGWPMETWVWDGVDWTPRVPVTSPEVWPGTWNMVFDENRGVAVLLANYTSVGTSSYHKQTWEWNGTDWRHVDTANAPTVRSNFGMAYDVARRKSVIFGGWLSVSMEDLEKRTTPEPTVEVSERWDYPNNVSDLLVSDDGSRALVMSSGGDLDVRDASGAVVKTVDFADLRQVLELTSDGSLAVIQEGVDTVVYDLNHDVERFRREWSGAGIRLSGNGDRLVRSSGASLVGYAWNGTVYEETWQCALGGSSLSDFDVADNGALVMGYSRSYTFEEPEVRYHLVDGNSGELCHTYIQHPDPTHELQFIPIAVKVNDSGTFGVSINWGGDRSMAELVVFSPATASPIFEIATPGSAQELDVKGNLVALGTKGVHANIYGGGGEVYVADLTQRLQHIPPNVSNVTVEPWLVAPGQGVVIGCLVSDADGVAAVVAGIRSEDGSVAASVDLYDDGLHGDGLLSDGVYAGAWTTASTPHDYTVDITATDVLGDAATYPSMADFTTGGQPWVRFSAVTLRDNPHLSPNIYSYFALTLVNNGSKAAEDVTVSLSTNDAYVINYYFSYNFGNIDPSATAQSSSTAGNIKMSPLTPGGHVVSMDLVVSDARGHRWTDTFEFPAVVDDQGPAISAVTPSARFVVPANPIGITALIEDGSGVATAGVTFESPKNTPVATVNMFDDGAHGDGAAGDRVFGALWVTDATPRDYYVSVTASDTQGNGYSYRNATRFTTISFAPSARVLLVNGGYNDYEGAVDAYRAALAALGVPFDYWNPFVRGEIPSEIFDRYLDGVVIWSFYYNAGQLTESQRLRIVDYLDAGGNLVISGQRNGDALRYTELFTDYLHATPVSSSVNLSRLVGVAGDPIGDGMSFTVNLPDRCFEVDVTAPAYPSFAYDPASGLGDVKSSGTGCFRVDDGYKAFFMNFSFRDVAVQAERDMLLARILGYMGVDLPPTGYAWAPVTSAKVVDRSFGVTVLAADAAGRAVPQPFDPAVLKAFAVGEDLAIGEGAIAQSFPVLGQYAGSRAQVIYTAEELGSAGTIRWLALNIASAANVVMKKWTIRLRHTDVDTFTSGYWEPEGWTTVYQADETISVVGWRVFEFSELFDYDGVRNLLVDFSFVNYETYVGGRCYHSTPGGNRSMYFYTGSQYGDPLTWSGTTPTALLTSSVPNIRLGVGQAVPIAPPMTGAFADGVWHGEVTLGGRADAVVLRAEDAAGRFGESNAFAVVNPEDMPSADFFAEPTDGDAPLTVHFADISTPGASAITHWLWAFGDGMTSEERDPTYAYGRGGRYTVALTVTTDLGSSSEVKSGYIGVEQDLPAMGAAGALLLAVAGIAVVRRAMRRKRR
ncbi:MAG TPA: S8 family serine peptidase [Candidatus Hydrogenedentes bacterium]|nr:S8 family serine peptidase [Candidatus Hydrogenedentota bacterium]HPG68003.1 S8 family serine peptidase [Candidatus Hydrogenedentota bacterium]